MNPRVRWRMVALTAGVGLMGLFIGLMTLNAQRQTERLRFRLNRVDSESFYIGDRFRDLLRQVNNSLYRYAGDGDLTALTNFTLARNELDAWIELQKPKLTSENESALMQQIDDAYDEYQRVATAIGAHLQNVGPTSATMRDFRPLIQVSQRLFDLGGALARAHYNSRGQLLAEANHTLSSLRTMELVSLGCLFLFAIALAQVVYRDMIAPLKTRLVESQTLLERKEKLASLGMLAAGIAHEIRNPLTAIKAALFLQQKKFSSGSQEYADAKIVEREILRLERIVNDFLLFARPSEPQLSTLSAPGALQEVASLLSPQLQNAEIQLTVEESPPLQIRADAAQLKQVLINLVRNAADAIGSQGKIRLRVRSDRQKLGGKECDVAVLEVIDNGKGIPPDVQKRLFDPFFTTKDTGTGLGLCIAAGIIQEHGGALQYQTEVDYGTTFGILLPVATE